MKKLVLLMCLVNLTVGTSLFAAVSPEQTKKAAVMKNEQQQKKKNALKLSTDGDGYVENSEKKTIKAINSAQDAKESTRKKTAVATKNQQAKPKVGI